MPGVTFFGTDDSSEALDPSDELNAVCALRLHERVIALEAWRRPHGKDGGVVNESTAVMEEELANIGATIMGRNMFGGGPGPWSKTDPWNGWWGRNPPFHHPVFALTHHAREPLMMQGGTIFTFVTDGIERALEQALYARRPNERLVHHSDRGSQYLAIRYTERLAAAGVEASVGTRGDSYDNALAESVIGLYKTELIRQDGPWRNLDHVEYATLDWVHWFNTQRLLEPLGYLPPAEFEAQHYAAAVPQVMQPAA
jgi:dihydrofolate reductase